MKCAFPTAMIAMSLAAAIGYIPSREWSKVIYWIAAAVLTAAVTFGHWIDKSN